MLIDRDQKCNDTSLVNLVILKSLVSVYIKKELSFLPVACV